MKTDLFDFILPESLIAAQPVTPRDAARMLVVSEQLEDSLISKLPQFLREGDIMVFNNTKVIPARLWGYRGQAKVEILLHKQVQDENRGKNNAHSLWRCFAKPAKRLKPEDVIIFADGFSARVLDKLESGEVLLQFECVSLMEQLEQHGHMPLPPYIERQRPDGDVAEDRSSYQTVYAAHEGSVAAPTAGLHFTERLLSAIDAAGVQRVYVTLHIGGGTFLPVKVDDTKDHVMHSEYAVVSAETANQVNEAKKKGGRVISVGTTSLRTLESASDDKGQLQPFTQETSIFITPGYRFRMVDMLLTNFHLPRSTLFMLVSAFSGLDTMQAAYRHAIEKQYRFYSYGDACLLSLKP